MIPLVMAHCCSLIRHMLAGSLASGAMLLVVVIDVVAVAVVAADKRGVSVTLFVPYNALSEFGLLALATRESLGP